MLLPPALPLPFFGILLFASLTPLLLCCPALPFSSVPRSKYVDVKFPLPGLARKYFRLSLFFYLPTPVPPLDHSVYLSLP